MACVGQACWHAVWNSPARILRFSFSAAIRARLIRWMQYVHFSITPRQRTVTVYTAPDQSVGLREDQTLDGGAVLPGFTLPLRELFAELDPH